VTDTKHVYSPPQDASGKDLPTEVADYLDGTDLLAKTQALRLSTNDQEGWPRASLLSAGDMLALPSGRIRFVIHPSSGTTTNLLRDGRVTLTLSMDGGMWGAAPACAPARGLT
jgi:hypothetical protein